MVSDKPELEQLDSPALVGPYSTATSPCSIPKDFPAYTQIIFSLDRVNELLLEKPDRNWDKTPSIASSTPTLSRLENPLFPPVLDETHYIESARLQAKWAAHNINVLGGNAGESRALIDSETYWETEALHYTALLHEHIDQVNDVVPYWRQEAARQKEALARWMSLIECHAHDLPEDKGKPIDHNEETDCIPEKREALYYKAILHEHLNRAVDMVPFWRAEAAYQREALTQWVPSLEDCADSLRDSIDQLGYWWEESGYLTAIYVELAESSEKDS